MCTVSVYVIHVQEDGGGGCVQICDFSAHFFLAAFFLRISIFFVCQ